MTDLVNAFMGVFDPVSFALITGGTIFGIIFGAIPGLTATLAVILLIPLSYGLEPTQGSSMLVGVYIGGISGGVVAAVLLGMPGTPSSMVTVLDGFALAKQGRAGKALGAGVTANLAGSFIGWLFLIALAPQVARFALKFGPIENTAVLLFGFTAVISLSGGSITKGICMTALGMAFSTVGVDPISSMERNTLGFSVLTNGISQMPAMIGLFVVAQAFAEMDTLSERFIIAASRLTDRFMSLTELRASLPNFIRSGLIGTAIGILPGIGQNASTLISYNLARTVSKTPEEFGHGCPEGICASETSNNATNGGALIPLVCLGIPGDLTTSALIGGLMIHGLQPGPLLYSQHPELVGGIMVAYFMANVVMYVMELGLMKAFVRMVNVKLSFLFPAIVACCVLGVYTLNNRMFDVWVMIIFGFVGYLLICLGIDMAPVILGFILGPLIEKYMRMALISANGNWADMFNRPVSVFFVVIAILFVVVPVIKKAVSQGKKKA